MSGGMGKNKARVHTGHPEVWVLGNRSKAGCPEGRFWWKAGRDNARSVAESQNAEWRMLGEGSRGNRRHYSCGGVRGCWQKGTGLPQDGWGGRRGRRLLGNLGDQCPEVGC